MEMREGEIKRSKAGFTTGLQTPRMWERMCGLFPATKAISPWKNFREWHYLIQRLGGMGAPDFGTKPSAVFVQCPNGNSRSEGLQTVELWQKGMKLL